MKSMRARLGRRGALTSITATAIVPIVVTSAMLSGTIVVGGCASPWHNESADLSAQDSETALRIKSALIDEPTLAGAAIDVVFDDGRARLTGFVETTEQRDIAASVARRHDGVTTVVNEIVVK